jgi:hypothetical protein
MGMSAWTMIASAIAVSDKDKLPMALGIIGLCILMGIISGIIMLKLNKNKTEI